MKYKCNNCQMKCELELASPMIIPTKCPVGIKESKWRTGEGVQKMEVKEDLKRK